MDSAFYPIIEPFYDKQTSTISYVVHDGESAAIIDPVLDYDPKSGQVSTVQGDALIDYIRSRGLQLIWILETHAHADHLSGAAYLKQHLGGKIAIGSRIKEVQTVFKHLFNLDERFQTDGSQFDHLFEPDEIFNIGTLSARAWFVPGHTPADMAFQIGDALFVGDTLFMPDVGTARCDFPGGNAAALYDSIQRLLSLPDNTRLFMCHDYAPTEREPQWLCSIADQKNHNIHIKHGTSESAFIQMRQARDRTLEMPVLIWPSIQINIRAGQFPQAESNGHYYLKIPLKGVESLFASTR